MKTKMRNSSLNVYYGVVIPEQIQEQQRKILKAMARRRGWMSRREVAQIAGMETSTVSARINAMIDDGIIEQTPRANYVCPKSTVHVHGIRVAQRLRVAA